MHVSNIRRSARHEQGAVLFVSLILLLVLTMMGVMLARVQMVEERMASNDQNHAVAVEAAEAALRNAELGIQQGTYVNFSANASGLFVLNPSQLTATVGAPYTTITWGTNSAITYTGPALSSVTSQTPPQFVIEQLPSVAVPGAGTAMIQYGAGTPPTQVFRVTAHAFGGDQTASATLQSIFR